MTERYAVVVARVETDPKTKERVVKCYPDGAQLFYTSGPRLVRWVFQNVPDGFDKAEIQFFATQPLAKYPDQTTKPILPVGSLGTTPGQMDSSSGSALPDLITTANNNQEGYFFYKVVLSGKGVDSIVSDPGGGNSGDPQNPLPWPPG
jgi:hypothetical protein